MSAARAAVIALAAGAVLVVASPLDAQSVRYRRPFFDGRSVSALFDPKRREEGSSPGS